MRSQDGTRGRVRSQDGTWLRVRFQVELMQMQKGTSMATKLLRAIIAKSFIEIALVCAVATLAAFATFSPQLRGAIDVADQSRIAGWVHDPQSPDAPLEVQLFIDGKFRAAKLADELRDDLVRAGATTRPNHGFSFPIEEINLPTGEHSAQVYAVRNAAGSSKVLLPITNSSLKFQVSR